MIQTDIDTVNLVETAIKTLCQDGHFEEADAVVSLIEMYVGTHEEKVNLQAKVDQLQARLYLNGLPFDVKAPEEVPGD